jgi:hypothetical protein
MDSINLHSLKFDIKHPQLHHLSVTAADLSKHIPDILFSERTLHNRPSAVHDRHHETICAEWVPVWFNLRLRLVLSIPE